jgi:hypothetical protein
MLYRFDLYMLTTQLLFFSFIFILTAFVFNFFYSICEINTRIHIRTRQNWIYISLNTFQFEFIPLNLKIRYLFLKISKFWTFTHNYYYSHRN